MPAYLSVCFANMNERGMVIYTEARILSSGCNLKLKLQGHTYNYVVLNPKPFVTAIFILLQAYRKLIAERGREEPKLPVLGYTPDQLFFISAAQVSACTHMYTSTDAHVCSHKHTQCA